MLGLFFNIILIIILHFKKEKINNKNILVEEKKETKNNEKENANTKKLSNINMKTAYIIILIDLLQAIGMVVESIIIYIWKYPELIDVDPICTIIFSFVVFFLTIPYIYMKMLHDDFCQCMDSDFQCLSSSLPNNNNNKYIYLNMIISYI